MTKASELTPGTKFYLSNRKNAKIYDARIVETVAGKKWCSIIHSDSDIKEGDIFVMGGECRTRSSFQLILKPDTEVFLLPF